MRWPISVTTFPTSTVGNVLRRHGIAPAPGRSETTTWKDFIAAHMAVAGMDFFTAEVLTWRGRATNYVRFVVFGPCFAPEAWNRYGFRRVLQSERIH